MKAIVNVHSQSSHAHCNGLTYEVKEILSAGKLMFCLNVDGHSTDFSPSEVAIVDFAEELQSAYDNVNWSGNTEECRLFNALEMYGKSKGINFTPTYSCPA